MIMFFYFYFIQMAKNRFNFALINRVSIFFKIETLEKEIIRVVYLLGRERSPETKKRNSYFSI